MFKSLRRITYKVGDLAKAKQWYSEILNLTPAFDTPFAVIFKVGNCSLSLVKAVAAAPELDERYETFWDVDDIEAAYARLVDAGAKPHTPVKTILNIRIAKVFDPFGNTLGITSMDAQAKDRTVDNSPSESALTVTFCRALAALDDREEIRGPDGLAKLFLTDDMKKTLLDEASRKWALNQMGALYGGIVCRTAYIDRMFAGALADNIPQIVFLGAGYDTRAYRFKDSIKGTRIFEIDSAPTQKRKLAILKDAGVGIPESVKFIPADFKTDDLHELLAASGYRRDLRTLFIWEGVTYYLTKEAVKSTLLFLKTHTCQGSSLCFDYMIEKHPSIYAAEPFLFWISGMELKDLLAENGLSVKEHVTSREAEKRYLKLSDGTLATNALPQFNFCHCIKA
jgi:methyltransferase (TIGR00027 family)